MTRLRGPPRIGEITPTLAHAALLAAAGLLAGVVGSAGGITSLISYPALLAVGLTPLGATVTNSVALVVCWPGSALGSRSELRGRAPWLLRWGMVAAGGGAVGAGLLLSTPEGVFGRVVPFLLGLASVALLLQPQLSAWRQRHGSLTHPLLLGGGLFTMSLYNGYFGAGAGVMVLTLVLLAVDQRYLLANALKNMLVGVATMVAALGFVIFAAVNWRDAVPLGMGLFLGSTLGPGVARWVPATPLRIVVALSGLGLAVRLWLAPT
ncbi:MAG: sulfite exporter TauE/SafE family protein [Candidatus Dormibacteria bacterium]